VRARGGRCCVRVVHAGIVKVAGSDGAGMRVAKGGGGRNQAVLRVVTYSKRRSTFAVLPRR